jgi:hypothetical protein
MRAVQNLKSRGDIQQCWSCGKTLYAAAPKGHPNSITLGHYVALQDGGDLLDPNNHGPQCMACNYGDGARRTNRRHKRGNRSSYINKRW